MEANEFNYENKDYLKHLNDKNGLWYADILKRVLYYKPNRVLELGCGNGDFTKLLNGHEIETLSVDISDTFLSYARKNSKASFKKMNLDKEGIIPLMKDLEKNRVDVVVLIDVLEHLVNREKLLIQIGKVLELGGQFVFQCPNLYCNLVATNYKQSIKNIFIKISRGIKGFCRYHLGKELIEITTLKEGLDYKFADADAVALTSPFWFLRFFKKSGLKLNYYTTFSFPTGNKLVKFVLWVMSKTPFLKYLGGKMIFSVSSKN